MKRDWPVWTLGTLGATVVLDGLIIVISAGPIACGPDDKASGLAAVFVLVALVALVAAPSALIVLGLRDASTRPVPVYVLMTFGVPTVIVLSIWALASAWGATCGGWFMITGG